MLPTPERLAASGTEDAQQVALFCWAASSGIPELDLLFHIPNGGWRDKATAGKLKAAGVKAGVWDIFLAIPRGTFHGLFVEMKAGTNSLTKEQKEFRDKVMFVNYATIVCYDWLSAKNHILRYLELPCK